MKRLLPVLAALLAFAGAPAARAAGPGLLIGATEDNVRQPSLVQAKAQMDLLKLAGFTGDRISQVWAPGETSLTPAELAPLKNAVEAARLDGVEVLLTVTQFGSRTTPLSDQDQADFAAFTAWLAMQLPTVRRFIVGNEPNLNRYWLPQFDEDGTDAAAPAYEKLLALTYDALKAVDPDIQVLGGAISPRGGDVAGGIRPTHSPTAFLRDMGAAYRASGRTLPIMDALAFHPYEDNSSVAPAVGLHPNTTTIALGDYGKLVALLDEAFGGTAQPGAGLPIVYDEFGVETQIPPDKASLYTGTEPVATVKPVDEPTQAAYYRQAIAMVFCQPTVEGLFLFHSVDETDLAAWQSGLYYADGTPKASLAPTRLAMQESRRGVIAACPGLHLRPAVSILPNRLRPTLRCSIDCAYVARLVRLPRTVARTARGRALGGTPKTLALSGRGLRPGRYEIRLDLSAPVNPAPTPLAKRTPPFRLP